MERVTFFEKYIYHALLPLVIILLVAIFYVESLNNNIILYFYYLVILLCYVLFVNPFVFGLKHPNFDTFYDWVTLRNWKK